MCLCFIDWQKALAVSIGPNCWKYLELLELTGGNVAIYTCASIKGKPRDWTFGRGVRQRCCMSPILFKLCGGYLMKEVLAEVGDWGKVY